MHHPDDSIHPEAAVAPGFLVHHASRSFNRFVDNALRPHGLSMALLGPLLLLAWKGPLLQRDLVQHSAVKQPAMVALLDKLEAVGAIQRAPAITDRRAAIVRLTDKGQMLAELGGQALRDANAHGLRHLSLKEAAELVRLLQKFTEGLD